MYIQTQTKHRPEPEAPPIPPSDMEKDIAGLRTLRKRKLNKAESEYRRSKKKLQEAINDLHNEESKIEQVRIKNLNEKSMMQKNLLKKMSNPNDLLQWMNREDQMIHEEEELKESLEPFKIEIEKQKKQVHEACLVYQKFLSGIEKLDILKEEMQKERNN